MELARAAGRACASGGWRVVYGGGRIGMMGQAAAAALEAGGQVIGVIPQNLKDREIAHEGLTQLHVTQTMHERQQMMTDLADIFIVLPGGLGTMAEFFEAVTWRQMGLHKKPVILVNAGGYWDFLIEGLRQAGEKNFLYQIDNDLVQVTDSLAELEAALKAHRV